MVGGRVRCGGVGERDAFATTTEINLLDTRYVTQKYEETNNL